MQMLLKHGFLFQANEGGETGPSRMKRHIPRAALGFVASKGAASRGPWAPQILKWTLDNRTAVLGPLGKCWKLLRT